MTGALSKLSPPSDTRQGYSRPQTSHAHQFDDVSDADIRNLVEGYVVEGDLSDAAERSFGRWYEATFADLPFVDDDPHTRAGDCATYVSGYLAAARDLGFLPSGDPT